MKLNAKKIIENIPTLHHGRRFILGVDGLSRSGKTTLVNQVKEELSQAELPVYILHIDDYIVEWNRRYNTGHEQWYEYYYLQWDIAWLHENLFQQLKSSVELSLPFYDSELESHRSQILYFPETCLIIIEGVFLQREEWRNYFDYLVYINCSRDKRFKRESEITQTNIKKFQQRYWKAEDYYLQTVNPIQQADMVLDS
jgi:uridine kinase